MNWNTDVGRRLLERLESDRLVWLTTTDDSGSPQPSLVWFWWTGDDVLVYSADTPKIANIERSPTVALNFNSDEQGGSVGVMVGRARIDRSHPGAADHPEYVAKYRRAIEEGLGTTVEGFSATYSVPILVSPSGGRAW